MWVFRGGRLCVICSWATGRLHEDFHLIAIVGSGKVSVVVERGETQSEVADLDRAGREDGDVCCDGLVRFGRGSGDRTIVGGMCRDIRGGCVCVFAHHIVCSGRNPHSHVVVRLVI